MFKEFVSIAMLVFIVVINSEKQIFLLNKLSPTFLIAKDIFELMSRMFSIIKKEKFMAIPHKINFIIKLNGVSDCVYVKCAIRYLAE